MVTVEDIEKQVSSNFMVRIAMKSAIDKLKEAEKKYGKDIIKALISGERKLTSDEFKIVSEKTGLKGINAIDMLEHLNDAQKLYLMKRMGYNE